MRVRSLSFGRGSSESQRQDNSTTPATAPHTVDSSPSDAMGVSSKESRRTKMVRKLSFGSRKKRNGAETPTTGAPMTGGFTPNGGSGDYDADTSLFDSPSLLATEKLGEVIERAGRGMFVASEVKGAFDGVEVACEESAETDPDRSGEAKVPLVERSPQDNGLLSDEYVPPSASLSAPLSAQRGPLAETAVAAAPSAAPALATRSAPLPGSAPAKPANNGGESKSKGRVRLSTSSRMRKEGEAELAELRRQLEEGNQWAEQLAIELTATSAELEKTSIQADELRNEGSRLQGSVDSLEAELIASKAEVVGLRAQLEAQASEMEEITADLITVKVSNAEIHEECAKLRVARAPRGASDGSS